MAIVESWLLCRAGTRLCTLPLVRIVETMRLLPIEVLAGAPPFVKGISIIRGLPVPILDVGALLGDASSAPRRLVTIRAGSRRVGLAFDEILGVQPVDPSAHGEFPPLLRDVANEAVTAIGTRDAELLLVLDEMHLLPDIAA